jgi:hypothetical protein
MDGHKVPPKLKDVTLYVFDLHFAEVFLLRHRLRTDRSEALVFRRKGGRSNGSGQSADGRVNTRQGCLYFGPGGTIMGTSRTLAEFAVGELRQDTAEARDRPHVVLAKGS